MNYAEEMRQTATAMREQVSQTHNTEEQRYFKKVADTNDKIADYIERLESVVECSRVLRVLRFTEEGTPKSVNERARVLSKFDLEFDKLYRLKGEV